MRHIALLRGINVGGNHLIPMVALKASFEGLGFSGVATYIQSGNVLFDAPREDLAALIARIEAALARDYGFAVPTVVVPQSHLQGIVKNAPRGFGTQPESFRYDVIFLKAPLTITAAMQVVSIKEGVDTVHPGKGAIYFSRLIAKATQSRLNKIIGTPAYKLMTIRNWNTTSKLATLNG